MIKDKEMRCDLCVFVSIMHAWVDTFMVCISVLPYVQQ